jgi:hypothetical protein
MTTQGVQQYSYDILPKSTGEYVYVENIGTLALNDSQYSVEALTASNIYKITRKQSL